VGVGRLRVWRIEWDCWYGCMHKPTPVQPFFFFFGLLGNNRQRVFGTDRHLHHAFQRALLSLQDLFWKGSGFGVWRQVGKSLLIDPPGKAWKL
jgi:hypothetical protein